MLRQADKIACEDTRQTQKLLNHFGIARPTVSYHLFNEGERAAELTAELKAGGRIAVVSDAGTPGIADPGAQLAAAAIAAGVPVFPIPGANAALSALDRERAGGGELYLPWVSAVEAGAAAERAGGAAAGRGDACVLRDAAPDSGGAGGCGGVFGEAQHVVVARELTKMHEEFLRGTVAEVHATLAGRAQVRGEMVLLFRLDAAAGGGADDEHSRGGGGADAGRRVEREGCAEAGGSRARDWEVGGLPGVPAEPGKRKAATD